MLSRLAATARVALPMFATVILGGCSGKQDAPPPTQAPVPADAAPAPPVRPTPPAPAGVPSPADARMIAALPEGVYLYYGWDCDGGLHLVMKNLIQDRAISLETHEGSRKLPQAVSASGVRYTDGVVTFWTKGGTATYQRDGGALVNCRLAASGNTRP